MRKTRIFVVLAGVIGVLAFAAAGCGGDDDGGGGGGATALPSASCGPIRKGDSDPEFLIASDLPLQGSNRSLTTEMADAIEFVLKKRDCKAGDYTIGYQSCDDSTAQAGSWDSAKCSSNARAYANNKSVLGVVGTFNSGCAKLEIPVANRAPDGPLAMVSPANTYPGLTIGGPGTEAGEPDNYYPTGDAQLRARRAGTTSSRAPRTRQLAKELGLKKVYVLNRQGDLRQRRREPVRSLRRRSSASRPCPAPEAWDKNADELRGASPARSSRLAPTGSSSAASSATTAAS